MLYLIKGYLHFRNASPIDTDSTECEDAIDVLTQLARECFSGDSFKMSSKKNDYADSISDILLSELSICIY